MRGWSSTAIFVRLLVSPSFNSQPMNCMRKVLGASFFGEPVDHRTWSTVKVTSRPMAPSPRPFSASVGGTSLMASGGDRQYVVRVGHPVTCRRAGGPGPHHALPQRTERVGELGVANTNLAVRMAGPNTWEAASTASAAAGGQAPVRSRAAAPMKSPSSPRRGLLRICWTRSWRRKGAPSLYVSGLSSSGGLRRSRSRRLRSIVPVAFFFAGQSTWLAPGVTGVPDDTSPCQPTRSERRPYGRPARMRHRVSVNACTRDVKPSRRQIRP